MANLKVRKECLDSEVYYNHNGSTKKVKLSEASQEQLAVLQELEVEVFEVESKGKDK